jgi:proliferating cell nuclear antigen
MDNYLVYIKTIQTSPIRNVLDPVKGYFPDIYLKVTPDGIRVFEMDHNKYALLYIDLPAGNFEEFYCPKETLLGVSVLALSRIFKNMDSEDVLVLSVDQDNPDFLTIEISRPEHSKTSRIELKLMDLPYQTPPTDKITFDSIIKMSSNELQKLCREFKDYAENIEIINIGNQLRFRCSNDRFTYERIIGKNEKGIEYLKQDEPDQIIQGVYKLDYLVDFTKCANLSKDVQLHLQNNFPLILKYAVGNLGEIKLGAAPKLKEEDD